MLISAVGVGYEKKTVLHNFKEVCARLEWCYVLMLRGQPWWVSIPGL